MQDSAREFESMDTEHKILYAARQEFMLKGFAGARTTSIAESAGVTHAMLHYYFRTKEKLFNRILAEVINLVKKAVFEPVQDLSLPFDKMIERIISQHLDFLAANPDLPGFMITAIYQAREQGSLFLEKLKEYTPLLFTILQSKINRASESGTYRWVDARMLVLDIVSLNVFSFIARPIVNAAMGELCEDNRDFIERRKKENFDTIMRKLKP